MFVLIIKKHISLSNTFYIYQFTFLNSFIKVRHSVFYPITSAAGIRSRWPRCSGGGLCALVQPNHRCFGPDHHCGGWPHPRGRTRCSSASLPRCCRHEQCGLNQWLRRLPCFPRHGISASGFRLLSHFPWRFSPAGLWILGSRIVTGGP